MTPLLAFCLMFPIAVLGAQAYIYILNNYPKMTVGEYIIHTLLTSVIFILAGILLEKGLTTLIADLITKGIQ
jgi:hypothetical protein